jgi:fluoroquinolone transport system permease protein
VTSVAAAVALDLRTQWRYGVIAVAAVLTAGWTVALLVIPAGAARAVSAYILFLDTATFGVFFLAALMLYERTEGALTSLEASPLRRADYVAAKFATLTAVAAAAAIPITVAATRDDLGAAPRTLGYALLGVALCSVFFLATSLFLVIPHRTMTGFLVAAPWPMVPFLLAPLLQLTGLVNTPALFAIPTVGGVELVRAGVDPAAVSWPPGGPGAAVAYLVASAALLLIAAHRRYMAGLGSEPLAEPVPSISQSVTAPIRRPRFVPSIVALTRLDLRNLRNDALLLVALAGPLLLAVALRLSYPTASDLVADRFGVDLVPYRPVVVAALVLLHVPMMLGMVASLLLIDDIDDRHLHALRVTPLAPQRYMAYRLGSAAVLSLGSLAMCLPLSGLAGGLPAGSLAVAAVLASAQAVLVVLAVAGFAGNKVEGLAMLKLVGGVMVAVPVAAWWTDGATQWAIGLLPPAWPAQALWAQSAPELAVAGVAGTAVTAFAGLLLARLASRRLAYQNRSRVTD